MYGWSRAIRQMLGSVVHKHVILLQLVHTMFSHDGLYRLNFELLYTFRTLVGCFSETDSYQIFSMTTLLKIINGNIDKIDLYHKHCNAVLYITLVSIKQ